MKKKIQPRYVKLKTDFAENLGEKPLQEYPRPQFVRDSYINLNGWWDYAITNNDLKPEKFDGKILVPFSPESQLSSVERTVMPDDFLHYHTTFSLPKDFNKGKIILHFGAVDCICNVFINGKKVGEHVGGYNAFKFDISDYVLPKNEIWVVVVDPSDTSYFSNGKQSTNRGGMWYTPQSGIWQTVWVESVPTAYIKGVKITPNVDKSIVDFEFDKSENKPIEISVFDGENLVAQANSSSTSVSVKLENVKLWDCDNPFLYDVIFKMGDDVVKSYFAMRKTEIKIVDGVPRITLNDKICFHNGLLDQGYWSDGLYTAPTDEALKYDVEFAKSLGFNTLRKHIKVEPMRWYYHCDKLGMLVWQDMPSGGTYQNIWFTLWLPFLIKTQRFSDKNYKRFSRKEIESRERFKIELKEMIDQLYNCPCICVWVPFNEGWGQFDSKEISEWLKEYDETRLVDHASGWHDQGCGDFLSLHIYYRKIKIPKKDRKGRAIILSEFGGYSYKADEHSFNLDEIYGYGGKEIINADLLTDALENLYVNQVLPNVKKGLCACIYTQLSDVEDETNGLLTYDRKVVKIDEERIKKINEFFKA